MLTDEQLIGIESPLFILCGKVASYAVSTGDQLIMIKGEFHTSPRIKAMNCNDLTKSFRQASKLQVGLKVCAYADSSGSVSYASGHQLSSSSLIALTRAMQIAAACIGAVLLVIHGAAARSKISTPDVHSTAQSVAINLNSPYLEQCKVSFAAVQNIRLGCFQKYQIANYAD